jgi:hypothetical protein
MGGLAAYPPLCSGPAGSNPPGWGVGGLPVNPPPRAREFRALLTFGSLVNPIVSSGLEYACLPGKCAFLTFGGRGLPANPPASRILNLPNPPTHGQGGRPATPPGAGNCWRAGLAGAFTGRGFTSGDDGEEGGWGCCWGGGGLGWNPPNADFLDGGVSLSQQAPGIF